MIFAKFAAIALALPFLGLVHGDDGPRAPRAPLTPRALAAAIEARADRTSFAGLERFGEAAARGTGRENLNRLQHVTLVLLNQSEFDRFEHFNGLLTRNALRQHDRRYVSIARVNALKSRYDRGDTSVEDEIEHIAASEPDWFARVYAMSIAALIRGDGDHTGSALALMSEAQALIPEEDRYAGAARAYVWESIGISLMDLYDIDGAAAAFDRADIQDTDPSYPRPDFDGVYDMTHTAVEIGDGKLARDLAATHHRLAERSDLPHLKIWDMNLCGKVAEAFGTPGQVIDCLAPLDENLTGADFLATNLLPMRAIAEARVGRVAAAQQDLARLRELQSSHRFDAAKFGRVPQIEAELLLATGHPTESFQKLRDYSRASAMQDAQRFNAGVRQITGEFQTQLETARRNADLKQMVIATERWVAALSTMLVVCAGGVVLWQRRVARRLKAAQLRAETANRSKSEFLANMSHEIRTPLNGVVGVADMLAASDLSERQREMVEIIRSSGQTLERLLSDVLDLARVEAGRMTIEAAPFNAADLVRAVAALSRPAAADKGLRLTADIGPELEGWFMGDAVRTRQILTNLVSNAVKFTESGRVTIIARAGAGARLRFAVEDTGVGFDAHDKERLFGRFQQADGSITRRFGGSGLGLAISRQLATLMEGEFDCHSELGHGSLFWFEAPFSPVSAPARVEEGAVIGDFVEDRAVRILLADDHVTNQTVIRMMLQQFGADTTTVANGAEALEAMQRGSFDVVLMDMQMPVMDGLEATRGIRAREAATGAPRTPVIMLTANALPEHCEASRLAGADGHLSKPVTVAELAGALNKALEQPESLREVA